MADVTTRIVIADDQAAIRHGFRLVLDAQPDLCVVGEAADGAGALATARLLRPDILLVDVRMPGPDGLEVVRQLAGDGPGAVPETRVIVVTTFDLDEYVYPALRDGAAGYLLKRSGPTLLVEAIRAAMSGEALVSPSITVRLLRGLTASPAPATARAALTEREAEVAGLVAQGCTNAEIAAELLISPGTVKTHVASAQRKVGARNRVGVAAWAWRTGLAR
ncbi:response regulator [Streptomyces sedi]|uniref:Response regulator transcription factor n=1 Tax=Streptomyces sedi TaxID=555059 RepID=A0A5C4V5C2_9ACTN|nr:response regulator transcription factor [Streptomyces sedi]TNM30636.1 response regulator transcription factor [Streptomyces sedi]